MILYKPTIFFEPFFAIFAIAFIISYVLWKEDKRNEKLPFRMIILSIMAFLVTIFYEPVFVIFVIAFIISLVLWKEDKKNEKLFLRMITSGIMASLVIIISIMGTFTPLYCYYTKDYNIVEGYVENFTSKSTSKLRGVESFSINGIKFSYSDNLIQMGYHKSREEGGVIKGNGQHLRIGYLGEADDEYKNIIVIEAAVP